MDLNDEQWKAINQYFSPPHRGRGRPAHHPRRVLDGILWKIRTGEPWRAIPSCYPSHQTCHRFYDIWWSSGLMKQIYYSLYEDLYFRGNFTPYQAVAESRITFHIMERSVKFYLAPRYQNDWCTNTALLFLQVEFRNALKKVIARISTGKIHRRLVTKLTLEFSKWPKLAPLKMGSGVVGALEGPEDITVSIKQQRLYPAISKKYIPQVRRTILGKEIFEPETVDDGMETLDT